eukprot:gnl/Chilomastix_caulleri/5640.p1 GENE.gnl/Chilomastix_caulleri/5640~~gnl/Chilomastix_caulleri/5640.p1  ORF type:complete len:64 (+),score=19.76 gnl/Chilomastix_caulleri/5640:158-349(+)
MSDSDIEFIVGNVNLFLKGVIRGKEALTNIKRSIVNHDIIEFLEKRLIDYDSTGTTQGKGPCR